MAIVIGDCFAEGSASLGLSIKVLTVKSTSVVGNINRRSFYMIDRDCTYF